MMEKKFILLVILLLTSNCTHMMDDGEHDGEDGEEEYDNVLDIKRTHSTVEHSFFDTSEDGETDFYRPKHFDFHSDDKKSFPTEYDGEEDGEE